MNIKGFSVILAALASAAVFADEMKTFYWTGGSGNWSDVRNWSMSEDGETKAERYPGAVTNTIDGVDYASTDDVVFFQSTASGTITLDVDVSINRFAFLTANKNAVTLESDAEKPHKLTLTTTIASTLSKDTSIQGGWTVTFRNIEIQGVSFDFRGGNGIFDTGAKLNVDRILGWGDKGCTIIYRDGCIVNGNIESYTPSTPPLPASTASSPSAPLLHGVSATSACPTSS